MVTAIDDADNKRYLFEIEPNRSLSWRESVVLIGAVSLLLLTVATVFATKGLWMIFPFAGLEIIALVWCTYLVSRATYRCQVVAIDENEVTVHKGRRRSARAKQQGPDESCTFPRAWVRVNLLEHATETGPDKLTLRASGHAVEVGEFLTNAEKRELAKRLRSLL